MKNLTKNLFHANNSINTITTLSLPISKRKNQTKSNKLKKRFKDIFLITTIHGIQNIITAPDLYIKFLWLICLIASTGFGIKFVAQSIANFLNFDIVTIIDTIYESQSQFPTVSLCSMLSSFSQFPVMNCIFNRDNCTSNFESFDDILYGKCYRFNSGIDLNNSTVPILSSTTGGSSYGLKLDLNFSLTVNHDFNVLALVIHNYTTNPRNLRNIGYRLLTGSINYFEIERVINQKLDQPYNECFKDIDQFPYNKTLINFFKETKNAYDKSECIRFCRNLLNLEQSGCNCVKTYESSTECSISKNETVKACYESFTSEIQKKNIFEMCAKYCPLACDTISYSIGVYEQNLPGFGNISKEYDFASFGTYERALKDYISVRVFYPDLKYTFIKQNPKIEIFDLVSGIGGTLGLFLGISFLSFIEIIDCIIELLVMLAK